MKRVRRRIQIVAILLFEASRIDLSKSDGNAEAHANICRQISTTKPQGSVVATVHILTEHLSLHNP